MRTNKVQQSHWCTDAVRGQSNRRGSSPASLLRLMPYGFAAVLTDSLMHLLEPRDLRKWSHHARDLTRRLRSIVTQLDVKPLSARD